MVRIASAAAASWACLRAASKLGMAIDAMIVSSRKMAGPSFTHQTAVSQIEVGRRLVPQRTHDHPRHRDGHRAEGTAGRLDQEVDALGPLAVTALDEHRLRAQRQQPLALPAHLRLGIGDRRFEQRRRFRQVGRDEERPRDEHGLERVDVEPGGIVSDT